MKKLILLSLFISLFAFIQYGQSQGLENFNNYPETSNAYHNGTFTGQDGSTWTYNQCRGDSAIVAPTPTLGKNRTPVAEVFSGTINGGCGTLSFDYKQVFSTSVALDVFVNGILMTTVTTSAEQGIVKNSGPINVNMAGTIVFDFKQNSTSAGQVAIDNISWTGNSTVLPEPTNYPTSFSAVGGYFKETLHWTDATGGQLPTSYLILASNANNIVPPADGVPVADDPNLADGTAALNVLPGVQTALFTGLPSTTPYYFAIFPYTNSGTLIDYKSDGTYPAANAITWNGVIIFQRDFNDRSLSPMISQNVVGPDQFWAIDTIHGTSASPCAKMSGYAGGANNPNEDWLITPAMNFLLYTFEILNFENAYSYAGNPIEVKISNNYDGTSDPNSATWTDLTAILSSGGYTWTNSGDINVAGTDGSGVYIAFKYTSDATNSSTWELDDLYVIGTPAVGVPEKTMTDFSVSPNPAQETVKLVFSTFGTKDIRILNVTGKEVYTGTSNLLSERINISNLNAGIYFIQVTDELTSRTIVKKLVVR